MKKQFITGVVIGGLTFGAAGVFAGQYMATENPFPVQLNGTNISLEGYNINDNTYFKLRDIADAVGGFTVGFENNTIVLSSTNSTIINSGVDGPTVLNNISRVLDPSYEQGYGLPVYTDGVTYYVQNTDVTSALMDSKYCGEFEFWILTATTDKSHWRVEYSDVTNDDMYYNDMVYAMDGGIMYKCNGNYYITLEDYLNEVKPKMGALFGTPHPDFTYQKSSNVILKD